MKKDTLITATGRDPDRNFGIVFWDRDIHDHSFFQSASSKPTFPR